MIDLLGRAEHWDVRLNGDKTAAAALDAALQTDAPQPGGGQTWQRWELLAGATALDAAVGRLVEGHLDAIAILREAGRDPARSATGSGPRGRWGTGSWPSASARVGASRLAALLVWRRNGRASLASWRTPTPVGMPSTDS